MFQKMYVIVYVGLFSTVGQVFGMYGSCSMVQSNTSKQKPQVHSFYDLVSMQKMDNKIFSNDEKLELFEDINVRYDGYTPLQLLIDRPDATVKQVKVLLDHGADINIPAVVRLNGQRQILWGSYKMGIAFTGQTPPHTYGDNNSFEQYCGNPEVIRYIFRIMVKQDIKKTIEIARLENRLERDGEEFFILPSSHEQDNWPEMSDDEARKHLNESVKDQKEFESFVSNLSSGAFDVFLKMQKMT